MNSFVFLYVCKLRGGAGVDGALHGLNPSVFQILEQQNVAVSMNSLAFLMLYLYVTFMLIVIVYMI